MSSNTSTQTTHDLWVESRQLEIDISRPTANTIELKITRPLNQGTLDGYVVLVHTKPITSENHPLDGTQYISSLDFSSPANLIPDPNGAKVVQFCSGILNNPIPLGVLDVSGTRSTVTLTITGTQPEQLYYASVHGASNVLQYYPVGVQSYPLEGSRVEKGISSYSGSVPSFAEAPTSPSVGMVYHDTQLNIFQYWTGTQWVPTRADSIVTGSTNPGVFGQPYIFRGSVLMIFDGVQWVQASTTNFKVVTPGPVVVPFAKISSQISLPATPVLGEFVYNHTNQRLQFWDGVNWVMPSTANTYLTIGLSDVPVFTIPATLEPETLPNPYIGQLFYNTTVKSLNVWTGTEWTKANTAQEGVPTTDKIGVGNDGSYSDRARLIQVLKNQLGWPVQCVELKEEQFNIAIDNALDNYRMWCDHAYRLSYIMFQLFPGQQLYYLNNQIQGTNRVVNVMQVHRLNILGIEQTNGNDAIWSSGILTSYYSAATVDILSLHLLTSLSEEFKRIFAGDITFLWDEPSRELLLTRRITRTEKVILECTLERSEQEILVDRWSKQFIQNWALAECKEMLGLIRSKFSSGTPGAAGTITLNGELLISEARQDMAELKQSALDYEWGGHIGMGNVSFLFS